MSGIVENGQIRLTADVRLPESATVYVLVPGVEVPPIPSIATPRLRHPEQAAEFQKVVVEENGDAGVLDCQNSAVPN